MSEFVGSHSLDDLAETTRDKLGCAAVLLAVFRGKRHFVLATSGNIVPVDGVQELPAELSIFWHPVAMGVPLVVSDAHSHPLLRHHEAVKRFGIASYLGIPISVESVPSMVLCAIERRQRNWDDRDADVLRRAAKDACSVVVKV